ncbi:hypothetical protein Q1695_007631 [Nippostrongylus brasiliensis]|nr:hypothetical protein Q1695_007631 [Nippostrongylus brasiliensis]
MRARAIARLGAFPLLLTVFAVNVWQGTSRELFNATFSGYKGNRTNNSSAVSCSNTSVVSDLPLFSKIPRDGILPPYAGNKFGLYTYIMIAPLYRLAFCAVPKTMSTVLYASFCFLNYPATFMSNNRSISHEFWNKSLCESGPYHRKSFTEMKKAIGEGGTAVTVIRHPVDRFLSGYLFICHRDEMFSEAERCYGCRLNLTCFMENLHQDLIEHSINGTIKNAVSRRTIYHFAPQTWFCDYKDHKNDYEFIKYERGQEGARKMAIQFGKFLAGANVPDEFREMIYDEMLKGTTPHSTYMSPMRSEVEKQLCSDPNLMEHILQIYFYDFVELGFL